MDDYRKLIFEHNLATINAHNSDHTQTYKMGVNHFTIYTQKEFVHLFLTPAHFAPKPTTTVAHLKRTSKEMHADVDWVSLGKVTGVRNQGACNAGWAFSAIGVLESFFSFKGQTLNLSEQQLIDCSKPQGNQGCNGGWPSSGLNYVKTNGITTESAYPYIARDQACKTQGGVYKINGFNSYAGCNSLTSQVNNSPIAVTVDATNWSPYRSGIFSNCATSINAAVLLVGVVGGAWKIKNSWGTGWG
jgi:C1A family cysteine protease